MRSLYEFDGAYPQSPSCPRCGASGFPDGFNDDGSESWFCDYCEDWFDVIRGFGGYEIYWDDEDRYADWERYYGEN